MLDSADQWHDDACTASTMRWFAREQGLHPTSQWLIHQCTAHHCSAHHHEALIGVQDFRPESLQFLKEVTRKIMTFLTDKRIARERARRTGASATSRRWFAPAEMWVRGTIAAESMAPEQQPEDVPQVRAPCDQSASFFRNPSTSQWEFEYASHQSPLGNIVRAALANQRVCAADAEGTSFVTP